VPSKQVTPPFFLIIKSIIKIASPWQKINLGRTQFILKSKSPRRKQLLKLLKINFSVAAPQGKELKIGKKFNQKLFFKMINQKLEPRPSQKQKKIYLAADTIVVVGNQILGKPKNVTEAKSFLNKLSGRSHLVITGMVLFDGRSGRRYQIQDQTRVWFKKLDKGLVDFYLRSGEYRDKAGAYGIQGLGSILVSRVAGSYSNVVGLPLEALHQQLLKIQLNKKSE